METATGEVLVACIEQSLKNANLDLSRLLAISMDGPKVNLNVLATINSKIKSTERGGLIDIGPCRLHTLHNCFEKGVKVYGSRAVKLIVDVYSWFNKSPVR